MTDSTSITSNGGLPTPMVFERDGRVITTSRDLAELFEKEHRDVLRAIDKLLADAPECLRNFAQGYYTLPNTGSQQHRSFDMDRDGFTLLAMGFTGAQALKFKLAYIEAFNAMENRIRGLSDPMLILGDPQAMRGLLLGYSEKVLALQAENAELHIKGDALDRIATAEGSLTVTEAAKALQVRPSDLFSYLRSHGWIYRRAGAKHDLGFAAKVNSGLLEHKVTTVLRADGSEKITEQVRVTPKGLSRLSALMCGRLSNVA